MSHGTMAGNVTNGTMAVVGWHEGWEQTYDTAASFFSLGGLDLGATSSPKRFEWVKMNLDTGDGRFCAVLQRSRAEDDKISTSNMMVDT